MSCCPNCGQPVPPAPSALSTSRTSRPGGRQVSLERGIRILAAWLVDEGYVLGDAKAQRKARRVLTRALPAKQKHPRLRPADLREAA